MNDDNNHNPANLLFSQGPRSVVLNGLRPSPLRVNQGSHVIRKPQNPPRLINQPRKQPVIIYTHSPKIIHTKPKDFMALVQKLTGFTRCEEDDECNHDKKSEKSVSSGICEDNDSSSVSSGDDKFDAVGGGCCGDGNSASDQVSPFQKGPNNHPYLTDFPLFTPNTNDLFSSSPHQTIFRYSDVVFASQNVNVNLSPTLVEFMKGLPEH